MVCPAPGPMTASDERSLLLNGSALLSFFSSVAESCAVLRTVASSAAVFSAVTLCFEAPVSSPNWSISYRIRPTASVTRDSWIEPLAMACFSEFLSKYEGSPTPVGPPPPGISMSRPALR